MKKLSIYMMLALAGLFMTACGPEDNEFASLKVAQADGTVVVPGFSAGQVGTIDLNTVEISDAQDVKVFSVSETALPEGVELSKAEIKFTDGTLLPATADGLVAGKALTDYVSGLYGLRPEVRSVAGTVFLYAMQNGAAVKINAGDVTFQVVPKAPVIAATYYLTGTLNDWKNNNTDFELGNGGQDPYTNPTYTCTLDLDALEHPGAIEFKATPVDGLGGDWSGCLAAGDEGKFNYGNDGGNFKIEGINPKAKKLRLTFNMLDQTWSYAELVFNEYIYEAGVNNDWGKVMQPLYCADGNGLYTGYFYAQDADWSGGKGAVKFTGAFNDWNQGNYGTGSMNDDGLSGTLIDDGGSGNVLVEPGFYRADVNLATMTFTMTPIRSVFVVGSAVNNDWDRGVEMTFNIAKGCWEVDTTLGEGVIKFKGNGTWDNIDGNWGGTLDNIINGSNDNIPISVTGKVHIEFFPLCDTKSYATITAAE